MSLTLIQTEFRKCSNCGFKGETIETDCPKCRKSLLGNPAIRTAGGFMTLCGVIIIAIIGYVINYTNNAIANSSNPGALVKWNASPTETEAFYTIFYLVLTFGICASIVGLWHLVTGRRNRSMFFILFGLATVLIVASKVLYTMF